MNNECEQCGSNDECKQERNGYGGLQTLCSDCRRVAQERDFMMDEELIARPSVLSEITALVIEQDGLETFCEVPSPEHPHEYSTVIYGDGIAGMDDFVENMAPELMRLHEVDNARLVRWTKREVLKEFKR